MLIFAKDWVGGHFCFYTIHRSLLRAQCHDLTGLANQPAFVPVPAAALMASLMWSVFESCMRCIATIPTYFNPHSSLLEP